jgi:DNA polymerase III subunit gamma/tau
MSYQVLARKWRPKRFSELVGQEHVVRALSNALDSQRVHHAFLFTGTRGVGKTTIARIFAKSLNCERGQSSNPCGECSSCIDIDAGRFVDLLEIDAASNTGVDNVRDLIENAQYTPSRGRFKVYLIDEVHMLSKPAFNALLKTLEEPPPHVKFLLATTDPQKLPVTVLSRCLKFNLKRLLPSQIEGQMQRILQAETIAFENDALRELARSADGSLRDGLSLLDQSIAYGAGAVRSGEVRTMLGTIERGHVYALIEAVRANDGSALMTEVERLAEFSPDFGGVLDEVATALHRVQLKQLVPTYVAPESESSVAIDDLAATLSAEEVQLYYQLAVTGRRDLPLAPTPRAGFEMTLLRMLAFRPVTGGAEQPSPPIKTTTSPARAPAVAPPPKETAAPLPKEVASAPKQTPVIVASAPDAPKKFDDVQKTTFASAAPTDWTALIDAAELRGPAGQVARNAALLAIDDNSVRLALNPSYEHLLSPQLTAYIEERISPVLGRPIKLKFEKSNTVSDTPAEIAGRERSARQTAAEESMAADPFVQTLMRDFGARILPDSVKPNAAKAAAAKSESSNKTE